MAATRRPHVAGGDHVGSGLGLADGGARPIISETNRCHVQPSRVSAITAAVAVAGVLAEADVADENEILGGS